MEKTNIKHLMVFFIIFFNLFLHTYILYPFLSFEKIALQALIRCLILFVPIYVSNNLVSRKKLHIRLILFIAWILIIPYTLYNFFQVRHIVELFVIPEGTFFTENKELIHTLWRLLPTTFYAFISIVIFCYCLSKTSQVFNKYRHRTLFEIVIIVLCSFGSIIGLTTRLDTFHILLVPKEIITEAFKIFLIPQNISNIVLISLFTYIFYTIYKIWLNFLAKDKKIS